MPLRSSRIFLLAIVSLAPAVAQPRTGPYRPEWESLKAHRDPAWFRDAKLGIYTHWGPITYATEDAPASMEWYGRQLYLKDHKAFAYHKERFGDQNTIGYKDVIPKFTAAKFNAGEWADLFARAGAKFAGPVAVHHDNFAMWDSRVTRWNSVGMGPRRDITGELEKAIRRRGMKFITTFHHGYAWEYFEPAYEYDARDGKNADLYAEPHAAKAPPSAAFQQQWLAMVNEVLDKYRPDLTWFDFELTRVITPEYQRKMFADTYNWAAGAKREIGVAHKFREIHAYTGILDFERGREDKATEYAWLTDTSVGPWFHHNVLRYRTVNDLVDVFVDIVSKNGCLLLNVGPHADGTIPVRAREILLSLGDWLKVNGEAIYGSRPWHVYGEGPTRNSGGGFSEEKDRPYTAEDIRYTTRGGKLYAIALGWPASGRLQLRSVAGKVERVGLLGHRGSLKFSQDAGGVSVELPDKKPCDYAFTLKVEGRGLAAGERPVEAK
jgi:alpha-L-fucosidase